MENLLSMAFDNLSSYDGPKVRKGLRQVEGLLANICLSRQQQQSSSRKHSRNSSSISTTEGGRSGEEEEEGDSSSSPQKKSTSPKTLAELADDPAFSEFFKLQEGFEWNVALRLVNTLDRLLARGGDGQHDLLILSALDLIQGVLLLHPPSKALFSREMYMNLLLDLLEPDFCPAIQSATLLTLVTALIDTPQNTRTFENLDGLLTVTSLFRSRGTSRDVKLKSVEFLYFYLMPELPSITQSPPAPPSPSPSLSPTAAKQHNRAGSASSSPVVHRSPGKLAKVPSFTRSDAGAQSPDGEAGDTRSQKYKKELLSRHLNSVDELVKDLQQSMPFGGVVC